MHVSLTAAKTVVTRFAGRAGLRVSKHLPEILTGLGIVGGVATVVTAAKSTLELETNTAEGRRLVEGHKVLRKTRTEEEYSNQQYAKDMIISYARVAQGVIKTYAIPFALGVASATAVLGAVGILKQRNAAITAAYNMLDAGYRAYKKKVVEAVGEEKEAEISRSFGPEEVVTPCDRANLDKCELEDLAKKLKEKNEKNKPSPYAVWIDPKNQNWDDHSMDNTMFALRSIQNFMNDKLRAKGHLFLNDVRRALGVPDTKAGAVTGWYLGDDTGDGFVDFQMDRLEDLVNSPFGHDMRNGFWVELNVDGVVYDKIGG